MHGLEEKLVPVDLLVRGLLEGEQVVGAEIALVVARALAGENGLRVVLRSASRHARSILSA